MAVSYTVPNSFSPNTLAESAKVNQNETYTKGVFDGLEATTKTMAKLKMDADPAAALEVATKQYVDRYSAYRRPVLQFSTVITVAVESGMNGTSGDIPIVFSDGDKRTETSTTRTTFDITRNAVFATTSGAQSGLYTSLSEANNTWYALYAVKVTDSLTQWCTVGTTTLPLQANYSTLNSNFGTNSWVYLGLIRNGDNNTIAGDILTFAMCGNTTYFRNNNATTAATTGIRLANTGGANDLTWAYAAGTGAAQVPNNIIGASVIGTGGPRAAAVYTIGNSGGNRSLVLWTGGGIQTQANIWISILDGLYVGDANAVTSNPHNICLAGFTDRALGVGSNPLL